MDDKIGNLLEGILKEKLELETDGKRPRVVLLGEEAFSLLEGEWLESIQELPWGDTLVYELERQRDMNRNIFLAEGSLFGLWAIRVHTVEGFKVY